MEQEKRMWWKVAITRSGVGTVTIALFLGYEGEKERAEKEAKTKASLGKKPSRVEIFFGRRNMGLVEL